MYTCYAMLFIIPERFCMTCYISS